VTNTPQTPAGWYPDPQVPGQQRYWDGAQWSQSVAPSGAPSVAPAAPPPKQGGGKKWLIPVVLCLALAVGAVVVGAILANNAGDEIDKRISDITTTGTTAVPGGPAGQADEVDDVAIEKCEKDPTTGWGTATIKVTNNSSKASTYTITIKFEDGKTSYGTGAAFVDRLDPGQSTTQKVASLQDFPSGTCKVAEVERFAS
jgi:hypothetical protein